mmetsp:Transcript_63233/g.188264  ORF Transcript_63233/g.188264 Transcript_63233/m.188264 type:complete len:231 (+) Transcript_63233:186-878(+)
MDTCVAHARFPGTRARDGVVGVRGSVCARTLRVARIVTDGDVESMRGAADGTQRGGRDVGELRDGHEAAVRAQQLRRAVQQSAQHVGAVGAATCVQRRLVASRQRVRRHEDEWWVDSDEIERAGRPRRHVLPRLHANASAAAAAVTARDIPDRRTQEARLDRVQRCIESRRSNGAQTRVDGCYMLSARRGRRDRLHAAPAARVQHALLRDGSRRQCERELQRVDADGHNF